ncbi:Alpha/Beta hydrolase protein [Podospora appendiculata]|uniref:Alpha/Beta hydrolase protein n=1 Tax=Podospora appendiculata TaxID=314037 RepID=A0AAE0WYR9_9PEZI|nr:Alpha/Beta hydrolase protein [Podospora appendiculata]
MASQHGIFLSFAKMKRLLPLQKAVAEDQDPPKRLLRESFPAGIKTLCSPDDGTIDIVFIHGLTGNRDNTWTARDTTDPWPKTLLPLALATSRILTFGYDAYVADWRGVVSQARIANHAWNLLTSLASYRENDRTNERPIIFVCHSLGGLVCEDALVTARQRSERHLQSILRSTRGIIFLGTPHHGAGLAKWAEVLSQSIGLVKQTNSNIVEVLRRDSEVLARIQESFHTMVMARSREGLPPIEISCFYEELPLLGVGLVVPQDSAILPGYIPIGIHSNHMDMTKFTSTDDPGFVAVCGELRRWIRDIDAAENHREDLTLSNDRDLDEQPGTASQHGDGNRQFNNFGTGPQKNVEGNYFEAKGDQHFGMVPSKESMGRKGV